MKIKLVLLIILLIITLKLYQINESFSNIEPLKINFNNIDSIILSEGKYSDNIEKGGLLLPAIIKNNVNHITSFDIDSNYYAMIAINHSEPRIYRGSYIIQNYNLFKYVTKIQIYKNTDDFK